MRPRSSPTHFSSTAAALLSPQASAGHLGWNRQPGGILVGSCGSPGSAGRSISPASGTTASNARVYGRSGWVRTRRVGPSSTIRPRYITRDVTRSSGTTAPSSTPSVATPATWPGSFSGSSPRSRWLPSLALARHAVAEIDDSRAEGAGLDEFEIHPALALGKERNATADQHRVDHGPVLVDETQRGRLGGERRAADRDFALPRRGSQPLDLLRQAAGGQAGIALNRR